MCQNYFGGIVNLILKRLRQQQLTIVIIFIVIIIMRECSLHFYHLREIGFYVSEPHVRLLN